MKLKTQFKKLKKRKIKQLIFVIDLIKKEYQRVVNENNHLKKRNEQLEQYIIKEERKKQKKSLKIKPTESSSSEYECQYYRKIPSKQRKNKQKYYDYE